VGKALKTSHDAKDEIQPNDPGVQELTALCLHLPQNALVLVDTVMLARVQSKNGPG
jgi:TnpA family transposase